MQLSPSARVCRLISMTCSVVISRNPHLCKRSHSQGHLAQFAPLNRLREKQKLISVQRALHVNGLEWPCIQMPSRRRLRHRNSKLAQDGCGWCVCITSYSAWDIIYSLYDCQHQASLERTYIENVLLAWLIKKLCFSINSYILSYLDAVYFNLTFCSGQYSPLF